MAHPSINLVGVISFSTLLYCILSIAVIHSMSDNSCDVVDVKSPSAIAIDTIVVVGSIAGLIGAYRRVSWLLWLHLFGLVLVILLLFISFISDLVPARDQGNWVTEKNCMQGHGTCNNINYNGNLTPVEAGCCKPPTSCGFVYKKGTVWQDPKNKSNGFADTDCGVWSNNGNKLCYDCNSCKAANLAHKNKAWKSHAFVKMMVILFFIIAIYVCWLALRNLGVDDEINSNVKEPPYCRFPPAV